jgi:hypothetical protein
MVKPASRSFLDVVGVKAARLSNSLVSQRSQRDGGDITNRTWGVEMIVECRKLSVSIPESLDPESIGMIDPVGRVAEKMFLLNPSL